MKGSTLQILILAALLIVCVAGASKKMKKGENNQDSENLMWSEESGNKEERIDQFFSNSTHTNNWAVLVSMII